MLNLQKFNLSKQIDTLIVPMCQDQEIYTDLPESIIGLVKSIDDFNAKKDEILIYYNPPGVLIQRIIFAGLGKKEAIEGETLRAVAGQCVKKSISLKRFEIVFTVPWGEKINMDQETVIKALMEGAFLANHLFDRYKKEKKDTTLKQIDFMTTAETAQKYSLLPNETAIICAQALQARVYVSTPSNEKTPDMLIRSMAASAKENGLGVTVLGEKDLRKKKFGGILAVGNGSQHPPGLLVLEYNPKVSGQKTIVLVGKGVTFDSGGINLKPTAGLANMKHDMSGAAAVAAVLSAMSQLKPNLHIIGVIPVVENMPSGKAVRPGDIIRTHSGKTVEIGNTDAEGRLILCDAIDYAITMFKPDIMIDIATLTGACVVALGKSFAGIFSNNEKLSRDLIQSGLSTHERCWPLPLPEDYKELIKSDFADIKNLSSSRWGGAITAALFLSEFVGKTVWAHPLIAGPGEQVSESGYCVIFSCGCRKHDFAHIHPILKKLLKRYLIFFLYFEPIPKIPRIHFTMLLACCIYCLIRKNKLWTGGV